MPLTLSTKEKHYWKAAIVYVVFAVHYAVYKLNKNSDLVFSSNFCHYFINRRIFWAVLGAREHFIVNQVNWFLVQQETKSFSAWWFKQYTAISINSDILCNWIFPFFSFLWYTAIVTFKGIVSDGNPLHFLLNSASIFSQFASSPFWVLASV